MGMITILQASVEKSLAGRDPSEVFTRDGVLNESKQAPAKQFAERQTRPPPNPRHP